MLPFERSFRGQAELGVLREWSVGVTVFEGSDGQVSDFLVTQVLKPLGHSGT